MSQPTTLTPYLVVSNAAAAIDFYKTALGAVEQSRHHAPDSDRIMHAHLLIDGNALMLSDDFSSHMGHKCETPQALGGSPITLALEVADANAIWDKAIGAGATVIMPLADQFWGARYGQITDPFGHKWSISQTIAAPSEEEMKEGAAKAFQS